MVAHGASRRRGRSSRAPQLPRRAAAARRRRTGDPLTDLRLALLRAQAREERALAAAYAALERQIAGVLHRLGTSLPRLCGLGALGAAEVLAEAAGAGPPLLGSRLLPL